MLYPFNNPIPDENYASDVDIVQRSDGRFAVLTTWKNVASSNARTLWMLNVSDLNLAPVPYYTFETDGDLISVDATDTTAFVAGISTVNQKPFQIYDISDPAHITLTAEAELPAAPTGNGRSVFYHDNKVYVGTEYLPCVSCAPHQNHELHIFDVSDTSNPTWRGSINVQRNVNAVVVRDGLAYLATGAGGDNTVFKMYDIDPASPGYLSLVGQYAASSAQAGTALYLLGDYAYVGRSRTTGSHHDFLVIDISDPTAPQLTDSLLLRLDGGTVVKDIVVKGSMAFVVTDDTNSANGGGPFITIDVHDPSDISLITPCTPVSWPSNPTGIDMADDHIFISNKNDHALQVVSPALSC